MKALVIALALLVAGCATTEPRIEVREVLVPTPVPCAADVGPAPQYADTNEALKAAPDLFARVQLLLMGREQRDARLLELEGQVEVCRAP